MYIMHNRNNVHHTKQKQYTSMIRTWEYQCTQECKFCCFLGTYSALHGEWQDQDVKQDSPFDATYLRWIGSWRLKIHEKFGVLVTLWRFGSKKKWPRNEGTSYKTYKNLQIELASTLTIRNGGRIWKKLPERARTGWLMQSFNCCFLGNLVG